jgi:ankyrin repeat protein
VKSKSAPSVILTDIIVPEKVLLRDGVKQLEDPSKVLVSGARTEPLLHWLIKRCKAKEIVYLVRERALDVNTVDSSNLTPLYHAVNMLSPERVEVVRSLVKKGANFGGKRPPILTGSKKKEVSLILQRVKCV